MPQRTLLRCGKARLLSSFGLGLVGGLTAGKLDFSDQMSELVGGRQRVHRSASELRKIVARSDLRELVPSQPDRHVVRADAPEVEHEAVERRHMASRSRMTTSA